MTLESKAPLRERKKQRTRQAISDAATALFVERGFDAVTLDEIADAAEVSKKTVLNYFRCKEDLLFDEAAAAEARLLDAVRGRAQGEPVIVAVRRYALAAVERMCAGEEPWIERVAALVEGSPALLRREGEIYDAFARSLGTLIRQETRADPGDPRPHAAARALLGVYRTAVEGARRRVLAGVRGPQLARAVRADLTRGYALLERGLGAYAAAPARRRR